MYLLHFSVAICRVVVPEKIFRALGVFFSLYRNTLENAQKRSNTLQELGSFVTISVMKAKTKLSSYFPFLRCSMSRIDFMDRRPFLFYWLRLRNAKNICLLQLPVLSCLYHRLKSMKQMRNEWMLLLVELVLGSQEKFLEDVRSGVCQPDSGVLKFIHFFETVNGS